MIRSIGRVFVFWLACLCAISSPPLGLAAASAEGGVAFVISIDPKSFKTGSTVRVRYWSEDQLLLNQTNALCMTSFNSQTKETTFHCPEGVVYKDLSPQEFSFPVGEIKESVEIRPASAREGQRYRIDLYGNNADGCNTMSANAEGAIENNPVMVQGLMWATTLMACPPEGIYPNLMDDPS